MQFPGQYEHQWKIVWRSPIGPYRLGGVNSQILGSQTPELINVPILKYQGKSRLGISNTYGTYVLPKRNNIKNTCVLTPRDILKNGCYLYANTTGSVPGVPIRGMIQRHTQASLKFYHFCSYSGFSYSLLEKANFLLPELKKYKTEVGDSIPWLFECSFPGQHEHQ